MYNKKLISNKIVSEKSPEPPCFITTLGDVTVSEGQSLSLECQVCNADSVSWCKDGVVQRNNADFRQTLIDGVAKLEMAEVFLDDYGTYTCVLKNDHGEQKCSCTVTVKGRRTLSEIVMKC